MDSGLVQEIKQMCMVTYFHISNLVDLYHGGPHSSNADGVNWQDGRETISCFLNFTEMKLRQYKVTVADFVLV